MPCVLPVIGLKILSFVEQSGQSRRRRSMLNVWYSLGLLSVFMVLATLAVSRATAGDSSSSFAGFNVSLAAVVFVMAPELPRACGRSRYLASSGRGKARRVEPAGRERPARSSKGVLTTILATPCSAPFLAPALTWTVTPTAAAKTFAVFAAAGTRHGQPLPAHRRVSRIDPIPAQAGRVDGDLQAQSWALSCWAPWSTS